jgi:hypothetical protein
MQKTAKQAPAESMRNLKQFYPGTKENDQKQQSRFKGDTPWRMRRLLMRMLQSVRAISCTSHWAVFSRHNRQNNDCQQSDPRRGASHC